VPSLQEMHGENRTPTLLCDTKAYMGPIPYTSQAPAQRRAANTQAPVTRSPRGPQVTPSKFPQCI